MGWNDGAGPKRPDKQESPVVPQERERQDAARLVEGGSEPDLARGADGTAAESAAGSGAAFEEGALPRGRDHDDPAGSARRERGATAEESALAENPPAGRDAAASEGGDDGLQEPAPPASGRWGE